MSGFDWEAPDEFGGGNFLAIAGTFHLAVLDLKTENQDGKMIDGFRVEFEVIDGTVRDKEGCTEKDKTTSITFFNGKLTNKDGGRFSRQKQAAFFVAANVLGLQDIELILAKKPSIDLAKARGAQVIATLEKDDKGYMQVRGTDVWHVDDQNAKPFPKSEKALAMIPKQQRRTAGELQAIKDAFGGKRTDPRGASKDSGSSGGTGTGNGTSKTNGNGSSGTAGTGGTTTMAPKVDVDSL